MKNFVMIFAFVCCILSGILVIYAGLTDKNIPKIAGLLLAVGSFISVVCNLRNYREHRKKNKTEVDNVIRP